jgi:hypothetical protein
MPSTHNSPLFRRRFVALLLVALVGFAALPAPVQSQEPAAPSLALVPKDASFYTSSMRLGEQIKIVADSNWWKKLNDWDLILQMKFMANLTLGEQIAQYEQWMEEPENAQLVALATDMVSHEVFCYGDSQVSDSIATALEVLNTLQFSGIQYELGGRASGLSSDEFMAKTMLDMLNERKDKLAIPNMVIGFKLTKSEPAEQQLARLEAFAKLMLENVPELGLIREKFKRTKVGGGEFLTLELDGGLVPWQEIPFDEIADEEGQYDELIASLKKLTLTISIGVHKGYALISVGQTNDHLAKLGTGEVLADHPKLAALKAAGKQRFTDVLYASEKLMGTVGSKPEDVDQLAKLATEFLPVIGLPEEAEKEILADVQQLTKDLKGFIPRPGAQLIFSYLTDRGFDSFHYNWSENLALDGSKPLTLTNHLGGKPLLAFLARGQQHPEHYDTLVKWLKKGRGYVEKYALPEMSDREREQYEAFSQIAYPVLGRIDEVNRKMLIPSLADGQGGFVIDANLKTKQWHAMLPPLSQPVALPSPGIVMGLKDAALFHQALGEYRNVFNDVVAKLHELNPLGVPDFQLPPAKKREMKDGTEVYYYPLPEEFGVYDRVAPNVAISDKMAAFSLIPRHTVRMIKSQPLEVDGGPLANIGSRNLASVAYFDWAGCVDMVVPWVNEGVRFFVSQQQAAFGDLDEDGGDAPAGDSAIAKQILGQIQQGADFLKAFRGYSSVTYVEDDALVTHGEFRFVDLE